MAEAAPAAPFGGHLGSLTAVPEAERVKFLHHVLDDACGRPVDFFHSYPTLAAATDAAGSTVDVTSLVASCKALFAHALNADFDSAAFASALSDAGVTDGPAQSAAAEAFEARKSELRDALVAAISDVSGARVADFDWSLRLVLSSGTAGTMRKPILLLTLRTVDADGKDKEVLMELTQEKLDELLKTFGDINSVVTKVV